MLHPLLEDLLEHLGCQPGHLECQMTHRTVELGPPGHRLTGDLAFECRPVVFEERPLFVPELMIVVLRRRCLAELHHAVLGSFSELVCNFLRTCLGSRQAGFRQTILTGLNTCLYALNKVLQLVLRLWQLLIVCYKGNRKGI